MRAYALPILVALVILLAAAGVTRHLSASARQRSALSVVLVVLGLLTAFFFFFVAGSLLRGSPSQTGPHASASSHAFIALSTAAVEPAVSQAASCVGPNPSLQPTCYGWLSQPTQAAELKR